MRILHLPYSYFPDPAGGTEVYVGSLANRQRSMGCDVAVAAPADAPARYDHLGVPVWRFPVSKNLSLRDLYGDGDKGAAAAFGKILDDFGPDIVHLHAVTSGVSVRLAEQAVERSIPIVLNYHTPTLSCSRGTLLKWGSDICDGLLDQRSCTSCVLHGSGLSRPLAKLVGAVPLSVSTMLGRAGLSGGAWTALRMPELIDLRIRTFHRMIELASRVIALCNWTRDLLLRNGLTESKITLCRQGISWNDDDWRAVASRESAIPLRAAFLGRFDATKGPHIVVRALKNCPELPIHLDLFGIRQGNTGNRYAAELEAAIAGDSRIQILPPIPPVQVVSQLGRYDFIVVPSQWLETGPLVVLEAFAARTPVIGSNLGGIAELVTNGVDGLLVSPAGSATAWEGSLRRLCTEPGLIRSLRAGIQPPRHTRQTALEIMPVYEDILCKREVSLGAGT